LKAAGDNTLKQNVLFWGHRRWYRPHYYYYGRPRVYGWYGYGPRRWHHRHWRRW
jgi:hypothetical protein